MLVTCQRFGDWFLFGLVWQYPSIQKNIIKVGSKSWILTCSWHITLSLPFYTDPVSKRELNFCNGYLNLLYFWCFKTTVSDFIKFKWKWKQAELIHWDNWKKSFHWWFGILVQKNLFRSAKRVWKENSIKKQLVFHSSFC